MLQIHLGRMFIAKHCDYIPTIIINHSLEGGIILISLAYEAMALSKIKKAGLPDGIFSNQNIRIWEIFGGSCNGRCWYIFTGHLLCLTSIWYT
jgi:hypothetical protein